MISSSGAWVGAAWLMITAGTAAFGSVYPWAFAPLIAAAAILGAVGLIVGRGRFPVAVGAGLALVAVSASLQLVPLTRDLLAAISPAAAGLHTRLSLSVLLAPEGPLPISIDPARTRLGLMFLGGFGLLLVGTARVLAREEAKRLAQGLVALGLLVAMFGIVQHATFNGLIYGFWQPLQAGSPFGPFVNRNHFAGWMLMVMPVAIGVLSAQVNRSIHGVKPGLRDRLLWLSSPSASKVILTAFALLAMAVALVLTMSRSGILAMAGALVFAATVMARRQGSSSRRWSVAVFLLLVLVLVPIWVGIDRLAERFMVADTVDLSRRWLIWSDTAAIIQDFWLTGTGLNTYGVATLFYQTTMLDTHLREAHNDYLQLAAEGGLLVGVPVLVTLGAFVAGVRRRLRDDSGSMWWIRMGAVTGLLAVGLQSTVDFSLQMPGNAALFAVLCGLALHDSRGSHRPLPPGAHG